MQALTARGNSAEALLVDDQLVQRLRDELGVPPSAETRVLHASILRTPPRAPHRRRGRGGPRAGRLVLVPGRHGRGKDNSAMNRQG